MIEYKTNEKIVSINTLDPNPWNPNEETDFMQEKLSGSLEAFGQVAEVLVRKLSSGRYEIIDGEHRWKRMKLSGATEILVNDLGTVSDDDAKMLTMVANELHGNRNPVRLAAILRDLEMEGNWKDIASIMPYNTIELENLLDIDPGIPEPPEFSPSHGKEHEKTGGSDPFKTPKAWIDIKLSIHKDQYPDVEKLLKGAKENLGVKTKPDKALENGEILKKLTLLSA